MKYKILFVFCFLWLSSNLRAQSEFPFEKIKNYSFSYLSDSGNVGIAIGAITPQGIFKYCAGNTNKSGKETVTSKTLFEIGSITKTFTGLLYTIFVQKGFISPNDFIDKYLPRNVTLPEKSKNKIKLWYLVTHSSGFPKLPSDFFTKVDFNIKNPYINYDSTDLYYYLSTFIVGKAGKKTSYSNLGIGLLGQILASINHTSYEKLITDFICKPLILENTFLTIRDSADYKKLAKGYNLGKEVINWDFDVFEGAGAIKSNLDDMLTYLSENINPQSSDSMNTAIRKSQVRLLKYSHSNDIATCWFIKKYKHKRRILWHDGGTGGFRSFIGFDLQTKSGIVILSNSTNSVSESGFLILQEICNLK